MKVLEVMFLPIKMILLTILAFIIVIVGITFCVGIYMTVMPRNVTDKAIFAGYKDKNEKLEIGGFQDQTYYYKYYYNKVPKKIYKSNLYKKVEKNDIEEINGYFDDLRKWIEDSYELDKYDFDNKVIKEKDYFYINSDGNYNSYTLYYYDIKTNILYKIHSNI